VAPKQRTRIDEARMFGRFVRGLRGFLSQPIPLEHCSELLRRAHERRRDSFLSLMHRGVYENPTSPYRELLRWAGVEYGDLVRMIREGGVEETLGRLFEAGVYITIDEFKGRLPIRRGTRQLEVSASDFDNPLPAGHFLGATGGSRGSGQRLIVDLDLVGQDAAAHGLFLQAFGITELPLSVWRPVAPGASGTKKVLMHAKLRLPMGRWFSQNHPGFFVHPKSALFTGALTHASRWWGGSIPAPRFLPLKEAGLIASWLSQQPVPGVHFDTNVSSAVRICQAATEAGLSLETTFLRLGGEPLTKNKLEVCERAGAKVVCHYSMSEVGPIAMACADPLACDDVHVRSDKMSVIQRPAPPPLASLSSFYLTTLAPCCPKIMLNVASGDYGTMERRRCSCDFGKVGFDLHLWSIRSYEKLTTGGMQFLGSDLIQLLDEVLPASFGGGPTDYQLVEAEQEDGRTIVQLLVSPGVGSIDEERCFEIVCRFLRSRAPENRMMVDRLREEAALRLVRREPYATRASKVLTLHRLQRQP
jgi:hypothetical protein